MVTLSRGRAPSSRDGLLPFQMPSRALTVGGQRDALAGSPAERRLVSRDAEGLRPPQSARSSRGDPPGVWSPAGPRGAVQSGAALLRQELVLGSQEPPRGGRRVLRMQTGRWSAPSADCVHAARVTFTLNSKVLNTANKTLCSLCCFSGVKYMCVCLCVHVHPTLHWGAARGSPSTSSPGSQKVAGGSGSSSKLRRLALPSAGSSGS